MEFNYKGTTKDGKKVSGKIEAPNEGEVRMILRGQGVRPQSIAKAAAWDRDIFTALLGARRVPLEKLVGFNKQLETLIQSGVPLVQALEILTDQQESGPLKTILTGVKEKVSQGSFFWEALMKYQDSFPRIYVSLIRAGEASGALESVLKRLSFYMEDADRMQKMLKSAMIYPIVVISMGLVVVMAMMIFVIPKFESLFSSQGQELPGPTRFVLDMSHYLQANWLYILGVLLIVGYLLRRYVRSEEGRILSQQIIFKLPLFGDLVQKAGVARFARTMSTLLTSGVNLVDSIDICKNTVDNAVLEYAIGRIKPEIEAGSMMGAVIAKLGVFPKMAVQMISVGESSGNLDQMLDKVAEYYEYDVENTSKGISKLIEPLIIVVLGGMITGLMVAMFLPIFRLAGGAA